MYKLNVFYKNIGRSFHRAVPVGVLTDEQAIVYAEKFTEIEQDAQVMQVLKGSGYNDEQVVKSFLVTV